MHKSLLFEREHDLLELGLLNAHLGTLNFSDQGLQKSEILEAPLRNSMKRHGGTRRVPFRRKVSA